MDAVFLDTGSLDRDDLDLTPLRETVDSLVCYEQTPAADVTGRLSAADIAIVNKVVLDAGAMAACPSLKLICVVATGTNNIDLEAAARQGICVVNCREYANATVAQHVLGLMVNLVRHMPHYSRDVEAGRWQQSSFFCRLDYPIHELGELTLGIVGYGSLGRATEALARAVGMSVQIAEHRHVTTARPGRLGFEECLRTSDVVSLHCPLTEDTYGLIGAEELALIGRQGYLINTARGALVDEQALADALRDGRIAGAGLDVLSQEPPPDDHPLLDYRLPNLLVTPHCAWASGAARRRIVEQTAANIRGFRTGNPVRVVA